MHKVWETAVVVMMVMFMLAVLSVGVIGAYYGFRWLFR